MKLRLTIPQKGLILVILPLTFELIFVAALTVLLNQSEMEVEREKHSKSVIYATNELTRSITDATTAAGGFRLTGMPIFKDRLQYAQAHTQRILTELRTLCANNKQQLAILDNFDSVAKDGMKICSELGEGDVENGPSLGTVQKRRRQFTALAAAIRSMTESSNRLVEQEQKIARESPVIQANTRAAVKAVLAAGVLINILLAVLAARIFSSQITGRLNRLSENTTRLPAGQKLLPFVGGSDEIAKLDYFFRNMAKQLAETERVKRELIAMISHDLRTPLTSVQGTLTLLANNVFGELPEPARTQAQRAETDVARLIRLSNQLIDVEMIASGRLSVHKRPADLDEIVERSQDALGTFAEQHGVELKFSPCKLKADIDSDRIVQVLVNLLSNAIKYSPPDSVVSISIEEKDQSAKVSVCDHGRGIPQTHLSRVFEPFEQVEASDAKEKGGKGLGLAICKMIVEIHGGKIGVESEPGKGSIFWFTVPLSTQEAVPNVEVAPA
jgi:signal transduction histidine kinase